MTNIKFDIKRNKNNENELHYYFNDLHKIQYNIEASSWYHFLKISQEP